MDIAPFYFLNVNKPKGITSFDVIYKLRKLLKIKRIGHSGTLDPMAQGVMQIAVGNAARLLEYLPSDKEYMAEIQFGYKSTTLDSEGEIEKLSKTSFSKEDFIFEIKNFKGKIKQTPPKYSAIKVNGKKLCDIARKSPEKEIDIPQREVQVFEIELLDFKLNKGYPKAKIRVLCSKGTYIRTLAQDIAKKFNTDAYLISLTRTKAGSFKIEDSIQIEDCIELSTHIPPKNALLLGEYKLSSKEFNLVKNGVSIYPKSQVKKEPLMLTYNNKLVSIGVFVDNKIKIKKFFN